MIEQPYWWATVPGGSEAFEATGRKELPDRADVVIIGAGYTGLSAARYLAKAGASVVVLDRERIGWGASSRNGGQVVTGLKLDPSALVERFGERRARELFDVASASMAGLEALVRDESIACGFTRCGHLQAAWKPAHFGHFRAEQSLLARVFGHRVHLLSRAEQRSEIGTDAYHGVMVDEASAAINPAQYVRGLAASACRAGATIAEGAAATSIAPDSGRRSFDIDTAWGRIRARDVLVATNGYTDGVFPALRRRIVAIGSYIIATEPLTSAQADAILPRRRVAFDSKHFLFYFRLTDDRRLLFGGRAEFGQPDVDSTRRAAGTLREGMTAVFPDLAEVRVDYAWSGAVGLTRDQMPHAGVLEGVHYAAGYCGHGVAMATELGALVARRLAGEPVTHPLVDTSFPPIPLYSGRPWFLPLVGAYYQVKDWLQ